VNPETAYVEEVFSEEDLCRYSMFKLGHATEMDYYTNKVLKIVDRRNGFVAIPGTAPTEIPNAMHYIATKVASLLGLRMIVAVKKDETRDDYAAKTEDERQARCFVLNEDEMSFIQGMEGVLLDDCLASGTSLDKTREALLGHAKRIKSIIIADFGKVEPQFEAEANARALRGRYDRTLADLFNDSGNFTTSKLILYSFCKQNNLPAMVKRLSPDGLLNLYLSGLVYFGGTCPNYDVMAKKALLYGFDFPKKVDDSVLSALAFAIRGSGTGRLKKRKRLPCLLVKVGCPDCWAKQAGSLHPFKWGTKNHDGYTAARRAPSLRGHGSPATAPRSLRRRPPCAGRPPLQAPFSDHRILDLLAPDAIMAPGGREHGQGVRDTPVRQAPATAARR
jgi:hypothetical protein